MTTFWQFIDRIWISLASVKLTFVIFVALLLLSIPGTLVLQENISNIDPALQYDYEFWRFAKWTQLFTAYHSFWYVGLIVVLSLNLITCSVERWPSMWKAAHAKGVALSQEAFLKRDTKFLHQWQSEESNSAFKEKLEKILKSKWIRPHLLQSSKDQFQVFWQTGRWSRLANYLVHTSLLLIFLGAIYSGIKGFEGAANIPEGKAVDTFLLFKEGAKSDLPSVPTAAPNERLLPFRVEAEYFHVDFYEDYPGRPKDFRTKLNILDRRSGRVLDSKVVTVNDPLSYGDFTFYQASYGSMGNFDISMRVIDKHDPYSHQSYFKTNLGTPQNVPNMKNLRLVVLRAMNNVQGLGPGVQVQELKGDQPTGEAFWVLKNYPEFDFEKRESSWGLVLESLDEKHFSGLQIAHDPGAPIYWLGCLGMLLGTFYALFVQHRRYHLMFDKGKIYFTGSTNRLPLGFESDLKKMAQQLQTTTSKSEKESS